MKEKKRKERRKKVCCCHTCVCIWVGEGVAGWKWHSAHLPCVFLRRCRGGRGRQGGRERPAGAAPAAPRAQPGLVLQGLPLLRQVLPHLPPPQGPPADTHRSVSGSALATSPPMKHLSSLMQNSQAPLVLTLLLGVRSTYWFMSFWPNQILEACLASRVIDTLRIN